MSDFITQTTPVEVSPGRYLWMVPDGWQQGRGAFGGLVMGALIRALEASGPGDARVLRAVTATLCGPTLVGEATITTSNLRVGSGTQTMEARLTQGDELRVHVVATFGKSRAEDVGTFQDVTAPEMPDWRELFAPNVEPPLGPVFGQHLECRPVGTVPYSQVDDRLTQGYIRFRAPGEARDRALLAGMIDAWWSGLLPTFDRPRPMATLTYTLHLLAGFDGLDPDAPLYHTGYAVAGDGGYLTEERKLWGADGRLMAYNHQTMVVIK